MPNMGLPIPNKDFPMPNTSLSTPNAGHLPIHVNAFCLPHEHQQDLQQEVLPQFLQLYKYFFSQVFSR